MTCLGTQSVTIALFLGASWRVAASPEPLLPTKIGEAAATLAAAFHDDPLSRFLLPREESRRRWLHLTMNADLRQVLPEGHVYTVGGEDVEGVVGWLPPGRYPLPTLRSLRFLAGIIVRVPTGGISVRSVARAVQITRLWERLHLRERHWYLYVLGAHPSQQGKGLGRALLDPILARADSERLPAYTETSNPRNLTFYGHFGFDVVQEVQAPGGGPPMWTLLRPPVG